MRWSDVDLQKGIVRLQAAQKNRNEPIREIPIKRSLLGIIQAWKAEDEQKGLEYVIHYRGKPVKNIHGSWAKIHRLAGLPNYFRPYDLRHAFATDALASGADVGTVAKLMGHTSPLMVLKTYQHVLTPQKQAVIEALPDIPEDAHNGMPKKTNAFIQ
jgi:integrase